MVARARHHGVSALVEPKSASCGYRKGVLHMQKFISIIAACIGTLLLAAGIALPSASADPHPQPQPEPDRG